MVANPGPKPFGDGAQETGYPGYFAANDFFDSTGEDDRWVTNAQIRFPAQSMYLVDSFVGEVIADEPVPFDDTKDPSTLEVDFRYGDMCLMLFLDGHVEAETVWMDLDELSKRRVRVTELTGPGT